MVCGMRVEHSWENSLLSSSYALYSDRIESPTNSPHIWTYYNYQGDMTEQKLLLMCNIIFAPYVEYNCTLLM